MLTHFKNFLIATFFLFTVVNNTYAFDVELELETLLEIKAPLTSLENAEIKLKANGFLLVDEVYNIWNIEKTQNVLEKLTQKQKETISDEWNVADEECENSALSFGKSINDKLEKALYQEGVYYNKMLKAARNIAKKHGIKTGDIFTVEDSLAPQPIYNEGNRSYKNSKALVGYPRAIARKRTFVMRNILMDSIWQPQLMVKHFGKYEQYNPSVGNPRILQMFYFKDINMSFMVNLLKGEIVVWRNGRDDR